MRRLRLHLHLALPLLSCITASLLGACDKQPDAAKKAAKTDKASVDEPAVDEPAVDEPAVDEPAVDEPAVDEPAPFVDDTKGFGGVVREIAADAKPFEAPKDAPKYDTTKDAGGLIGHLASGLAHDDALAASKTAAELAKLAHEGGEPISDSELCTQVWTKGLLAAYPDTGEDAKEQFMHACKSEVERQRVKLGVEIFAQHGACVLAAADLGALDLCDTSEQAAEEELHAHPHGDRLKETACRAGVEHIFILVSREMSSDPDLLEILEEDIEEIKDDAMLACRDEATKEELACVMKAAALSDLEACGGPV